MSGFLDRALRRSESKPTPAGPVCYVGDLSEFQQDVNVSEYLTWSKAVIIRALYGSGHVDDAWQDGARRDAFHAGGVKWLGIYAYLVASESAVTQARAFLDLIGDLRPGEKLICDLEEGAGSQAGRWQAWKKTVQAATGDEPWCYSDLDFAQSHGLVPEWVADFASGEPDVPYVMWQFNNAYVVPGVPQPCDASIFRGSVEELAALGYQGKPAAPVPVVPADWREFLALLPALRAGDRDTAEPWMVRRVQSLVNALGPDCAVTGVFDAATASAVAGFQRNHNVAPTGEVTPATWSMLLFGRAL